MLTEDAAQIETIWPDVFRRGVTAIRRKGASLLVAEDAVQEAGARAIARAIPYEDADDLLRWIQTVAWRIVLDGRKRDRRLVYSVADVAAGDDTERAAEARITAAKLHGLLGTLSAADLAALAPREAATMDRRESVRWAVRRHRVRARLIALLDGAAGIVVWLRPRVRSTRGSARRAAALAVAAPVVAISLLTLLPNTHDAGPPDVVSPQFHRIPGVPSLSAVYEPTAIAVPARPSHGLAGSPAGAARDLPRLELDHPGASGRGSLYGKPKEKDDHFLCVDDALLIGDRCVDLPVKLTE